MALKVDKHDINNENTTIDYNNKKKVIEQKRQDAISYLEFRKKIDALPIGGIFENNNCYYIIKEKYDSSIKDKIRIECKLTNFLIDIIQIIKFSTNFEVYSLLKSSKKNTEKIFLDKDFADSRTFKKAISINTIGLVFDGGEQEFAKLKEYIFKCEYVEKIGVEKIGIYKTGKKYIAFDSFTNIDLEYNQNDNYVMLERNKEIESNIISNDEISKEEFRHLLKYMFKFNHINKCVAVWGYIGSCFIKYRLNELNIKLPHLQLIGEAGSGKSATLENVIMQCFSMDKNNTISAGGITKFTATKIMSSSNLYPSIIEEYKPYKMKKFEIDLISTFLRSAYDGHSIKRGKQDQSVVTYMLESPVVLVGECGIDEKAIDDRSHILSFSKVFHNEKCKENFDNLKLNSALLRKLGKSLLINSLKIDNDKIKARYFEHVEKMKNSEFSSRQIEGIAALLTGYILFEMILEDFYQEIEIDKNKMNEYFLEEKEINNKSIVENTLEIYDRLGFLMEGWHYIYSETKQGEALVLDVKYTYDKLLKYASEHKINDEVLSYKQFTAQLRNSKYFIKYDHAKLRIAYDSTSDTKSKENSYVRRKCFYLSLVELEKLEIYGMLKTELEE